MARYFHSLVVFGAGVALAGCGGKANDSAQAGDPDPGAPKGGTSNGTGGKGTGGGIVLGAGGARSGSGGAPGNGGTLGTGGADADAGVFPDAATLAQWNCDAFLENCSWETATSEWVQLTQACPVDPDRPRKAADCAAGEVFECVAAVFQGKPAWVSCACTTPPVADAGACDFGCSSSSGIHHQRRLGCEVGGTKLCGCAITSILR